MLTFVILMPFIFTLTTLTATCITAIVNHMNSTSESFISGDNSISNASSSSTKDGTSQELDDVTEMMLRVNATEKTSQEEKKPSNFPDTNTSTTETLVSDMTRKTDNKQQPVVSDQLHDDVKDVLDVFALVFEALSVVLTTTDAYIYSLPNMRSPTTKYLVALNLADTVGGAILTLRKVWRNADAGALATASYHYVSIFGAVFLTVACKRMVYCFTLLVTAEQFYVVTFPLKARHLHIRQNPKLIVAVLTVSLLTYHAYLPLQYQVKVSSPDVGYMLAFSDAYKKHTQAFVNVSNAAKVLFSYIPLVLCLALSLALVTSLKRHATIRKSLQENVEESQSGQAEKTERQLAKTVLLSSLLFVLLSLPSNTLQIIASYHPEFRFQGFEHNLYSLTTHFAALSLVAARYSNFLAYVSMSTVFRRNLVRLLRCHKIVRKTGTGNRATASAQSTKTMTSSQMSQTQESTLTYLD